jgi:hypothetical protein
LTALCQQLVGSAQAACPLLCALTPSLMLRLGGHQMAYSNKTLGASTALQSIQGTSDGRLGFDNVMLQPTRDTLSLLLKDSGC